MSRFSAIVVDRPNGGGGYFDVQLADDGALFVVTDAQPWTARIKNSTITYPIGFSFGLLEMVTQDGSVHAESDHIWDEGGDQTGDYGTTANPGGMFVELVKVAAGEWQAVSKTGNWAAT